MNADRISAEPIVAHPSDLRTYFMNFTDSLLFDETIAAVNDVDSHLPGLTIDQLVPNATELTNSKGGPIAIGKAATFRITGGVANEQHKLTVKVTSNKGNVRHKVGPLHLHTS